MTDILDALGILGSDTRIILVRVTTEAFLSFVNILFCIPPFPGQFSLSLKNVSYLMKNLCIQVLFRSDITSTTSTSSVSTLPDR